MATSSSTDLEAFRQQYGPRVEDVTAYNMFQSLDSAFEFYQRRGQEEFETLLENFEKYEIRYGFDNDLRDNENEVSRLHRQMLDKGLSVKDFIRGKERINIESFVITPTEVSGKRYQIRLRLNLRDGVDEVSHRNVSLTGPLKVRRLTNDGELDEFAAGKDYGGQEQTVYGTAKDTIRILYGEDDADRAHFEESHDLESKYFDTTTRVAKELVKALDKHTMAQVVAEVAMAPRKGTEPGTRDPTFKPLPGDISRDVLKKYLGMGRKTRRRKTKSRKTRARRLRS